MAAINWKNFTLNSAGDSAPWGPTEVQLHKDIVDTLVKDSYSPLMDATNGHRHYRVYDVGSNVLFRGVSQGVMRQEYSATYYLQTSVYNQGDVSLKPVGGHLTVSKSGETPNVQVGILNVDGTTGPHLCLYNNSTYYVSFTAEATSNLKILCGPAGLSSCGIGVSPSYKFSVGSADNSDQVGIYHDNTDGFIKWNDGSLKLATDEGTNTNGVVAIYGKGTGAGVLQVYDKNGDAFSLVALNGIAQLSMAASGIQIQTTTAGLLGFYGATPVDQPATVTDPSGGGTQDAEARTAIGAIIDRLQELGLIA